jgi:hypothetical protein
MKQRVTDNLSYTHIGAIDIPSLSHRGSPYAGCTVICTENEKWNGGL